MFSLIERETFVASNDFREHILRVKVNDQIPLILVGNKADLSDRREVSEDEAHGVASSWGVPYIETSAKTKLNVDKIFYDLLDKIQQRKNVQGQSSSQSQKKKKSKKSKCVLL